MKRLAMLMLTACCPDPEVVAFDGPPRAEEAAEVVSDFYAQEVGEHRDVTVRWSSEPIDGMYSGLAISCDNLWVWWDGEESIRWTGLPHEIAHCYAGDVPSWGCASGDSDHSDERWWGEDGLVRRARSVLLERGL